MKEKLNALTVGLFGTCGGSKWRDRFMFCYDESGIPFFNPQVDNWTPDMADIEAWHLVNDSLILFPVTDETYAAGSLAEIGFSIQNAIRANNSRFVLIYIAPTVSAELQESNPQAAKDSNRARTLVSAHLKQLNNPNVFVANSMDDMLNKSLGLFTVVKALHAVRGSGDNWRAQMSPDMWRETLTADPGVRSAEQIISVEKQEMALA